MPKNKLTPCLYLVVTLAAIGGFSALARTELASSLTSPPALQERQNERRYAPGARQRNLSLQPEAFALSRRLGVRFSANRQIAMTGVLTVGPHTRTVQVTRTQTFKGERVEFTYSDSPQRFAWEAEAGAVVSGSRAASKDRELIERLVFDSADQFVLAQIRGAAYRVIGRAVRPEGAADGYDGTLWDIVLVDDPESDEARRPESRWRLYFINCRTGLIDKIVSEVRGERIETELAGWNTRVGETFPTKLAWNHNGQPIMSLTINDFAHTTIK